MKHTLYDVKNNVDVIAIVGEEVRRTVLDAGTLTLADLRENISFENRYMDVWDSFLDGHNLYADGKEYMEYKCDGYTVRFERDATVINSEI